MEEVVDSELKERRERQKLLKVNWDRYQERLKDKRDQLKRLGEVAGSNDKQALAVVHHSEQDRLARAEDELARLQADLRPLSVEIALLEKQKELSTRKVSSQAIEEQIARDPEVASLASKLAETRSVRDKFLRVAKKTSDAAHVDLRREEKSAADALASRIENLRPTIARRLAEATGEDLHVKLELAQERLNVLLRQEAALTDEVRRVSDHAKVITRTSVDLASIQEEIFAADEIAKKLAIEIEALNVELQAPRGCD